VQSVKPALGSGTTLSWLAMTWLPFHDGYLGIGKPIEFVDYLIDRFVGNRNLGFKRPQCV